MRPAPPRRSQPRPWLPWVRFGLVALLLAAAGFLILELGQRYLGLQKLTVDQVAITGCRGERLAEVQQVADRLCLGKPLFWLDSERLRNEIESRRWVKGLLIRRDPPDRLSLVIEERIPLVWIARAEGLFLISDDGYIMDRIHRDNWAPLPVVSDPSSLEDASFVRLLNAARILRTSQRGFYDRITELRWSEKGPVAYLEGLPAPIFLSRRDPAKNIPNFQALFLDRYANHPEKAKIRYFDLRWDQQVAAGDLPDTQPPTVRPEGP